MNCRSVFNKVIIFIFLFFPLFVNAHNLNSVNVGDFIRRVEDVPWMMPGYYATVNFNNGTSKKSSAFCLDSSRKTPTIIIKGDGSIWPIGDSYLGSNYDAGFYGIYLTFYEWTKRDSSSVNKNRAYFEAAARALGQHYGVERLGGDYSEYKDCKTSIVSGVNSKSSTCFGDGGKFFNDIKTFYNSALNLTSLRNTGKSVIPKIDFLSSEVNDENLLNIKFNLNLNNMFKNGHYPGIVLDKSGGNISNSYFYFDGFSLKINDTDIWFTNTDIIKDYTRSQQFYEDAEISLVLDLNVIENRFGENPKITFDLKYNWHHPLNPNNLFIFQPNDGKQRMLIITDYYESSTLKFEYENAVSKIPNYNYCRYENGNYYDNDNNLLTGGIRDYINKCDCTLNTSMLNESDKNEYLSSCDGSNNSETYYSTFGSCGLEESNTLSRKVINNLNRYCKITCDETIILDKNSLIESDFTTIAGRFFEAPSPDFSATKFCTNDIDPSLWKNHYNSILQSLINSYNNYLMWKSYNSVPDKVEATCCGPRVNGICSEPGSIAWHSYDEYRVSRDTLVSSTQTLIKACDDYDKTNISQETNASNDFILKVASIEEHFTKLSNCYNYLSLKPLDEDFYDLQYDLSFYYQQKYADSNIGYKWNNKKPNGVNDSNFETKENKKNIDSSNDNNNYSDLNQKIELIYIKNLDGEFGYSDIKASVSNQLKRNVNYEITLEPAKEKYVNVYTTETTDLKEGNQIKLDRVYDTDITTITGTYPNLYVFNSIGEENKIFEYYKNNDLLESPYIVEGSNFSKKLARICDYKIDNKIISTCDEPSCTDNLGINVIYRIVDPDKIDPNNRLGTSNGFKNWNNVKGQTVLETIQEDDTYNPDNLEYSFTLNSASIKEIKRYNNGCDENMKNCNNPIEYSVINESNSLIKCNDDGNECISAFIDELNKTNGEFGSKIATNISGRDKWKYLEYSDSKGYYIKEYKKNDANFNNLLGALQGKGVEVTP